RGRHLVEADLLAALDTGQLSAAVLDVFDQEPLPPEHPFWSHPKIIVTPHVAAATHAPTAAARVAENLRRLSGGRPLINVVDLARGYCARLARATSAEKSERNTAPFTVRRT